MMHELQRCHWFESSGCPWVVTGHEPRHAAMGKGGPEDAKGPKGQALFFSICLS